LTKRRLLSKTSPVKRKAAAKRIKKSRSQDRARAYFGLLKSMGRIPAKWRTSAGLQEYNSLLRRQAKRIEEIVAEKAKTLKASGKYRKVMVLDAGCSVQFIAELKRHSLCKGKVNITGLTLAVPLGEKQLKKRFLQAREMLLREGKRSQIEKLEFEFEKALKESREWNANKKMADEIRIGLAETKSFGKKFDVIVSVGMLEVALSQRKAVLNLLRHLETGGIAILRLGRPLEPRLVSALEKRGFKVNAKGIVYTIQKTK